MRLVYLDGNGLIAYRKLRGQLALEAEFTATEAGIDAFTQYAQAHRGSPFRLVTDLADESYHFETLPRLRGGDRRALLERKRTQNLPPTLFATTLPAGPAGPRQENVLHVGLGRPALLEPWLAALTAARVALASAHCAAQSAPLLFKPSAAPILILTRTRAGLRQMFLLGQHLRFSRLTPVPAEDPLDLDAWLTEADKTRQYLIRERALAHGEPLSLKLVGEGLPAQAPRFASFEITTFTPADIARPLGLERLPAGHQVEGLVLWALQKNPPREQLAPATARRYHQLGQTRRQLYATSLVVALTAGLFITDRGLDTQRLLQETQALPPLAAPPPPDSPDSNLPALREITGAFDTLVSRGVGPTPLLTDLSHQLDTHPAIEIDALEWSLATSGTKTVIQRINLTGHLGQALADPRAQLEALGRFTRALSETSGVEVSITRLPIDIAPEKTLNSQSTQPPGQAPFALTLTRSLP